MKIIKLVVSTLGGYAGWQLGSYVGLMTAFFLSVVGTALGHAALRLGTVEGFGPAHLLGEMDGMTLADVDGDGHPDVVTWREGRAQCG